MINYYIEHAQIFKEYIVQLNICMKQRLFSIYLIRISYLFTRTPNLIIKDLIEQHVPFLQMSYQKQKAINSFQSQSKSSTPLEEQNAKKRKRIAKQQKNQSESQVMHANLTKNKKQLAKQLKRIREQNRRANHKQYVTTLQLQIQKKQVQIQNLEARIKQLELLLDRKVCSKCASEVVQLDHGSTFQNFQEAPQQMEKQYDLDQQLIRINDDSSLRICFGNKNLLFFLVTMCCLTIGSIADNPQMFFEPIHPFMLKSQLYFLQNSQKLNNFYSYRPKFTMRKKSWDQMHGYGKTDPPQLDQNVKRVSDILSWKFIISRLLPSQFNFLSNIKDPTQLVLSFSTNHYMGRLLDGRNYYN